MKALQFIQKVRWTQENEPIRFFQPHGGQEEFLALLDPDTLLALSGAGNGWGKSELLAAILTIAMWPSMAPASMQNPMLTNWQYPKRARIYSSPAELEEIGSLQTAIKRLFPAGRYTAHKGRYSYPSVFYTDTGWVLDLFSYERDHEEAAGPNIGLQAFNEPPPEPLYKEAVARSRAGGIILGGMTSLLKNPWVVDGLFGKHNGKSIKVRYGNSCENCIEHGKNGNLRHARIEQILAEYDDDEREARFSGKPLSLSGRILKGFNRDVHVSKDEFEPPEGASIGMVMDPAIGKPCFILWRYVDAAGVVHYYDEYPNTPFEGAKDSNLTVKDYAEIIRAKEAGRPVASRILDRHFGNARRTLGGKSLKEEFSEEGIEFSDSYTAQEEVETGILKVKGYLAYDKTKPVDAINRPKVIFSPRCKNAIIAAERWSRHPETLKPTEEYKDPMDCVRYDLMSNPEVETARAWPTQKPAFYGVQS